MIPCPPPCGQPGNLGLLFAAHARSDRTAIVDLREPDDVRAVSFRALDAACNAVARALVREGLREGDRVGILSLNCAQFVMALLGAMRAGIVPVPVNCRLAADTVRHVLRDAGIRLVFAEPVLRPLCSAGLPVVEFGDDFARFLDYGPFQAYEPAPDSVAIQPYTSGSTGRPKGVLLSHFGQNWSRLMLAHTRGTTENDVILVAAPLYHKNALNAIKQSLTAGARVVLLPRFDVPGYIDAIGRHRCTVISGVPTMMAMLLARPDLLGEIDTSCVRTVMMGSAPASPTLIAAVQAAFPHAEPLVVYGVTEGGSVPFGPHPDGRPRPLGSIGVPYQGTAARLVDGAGPDEGELVLRNPGILLEYHNLPDVTAKRLRDGWYYTGDVCRRDADGFYWFVGRTDDMFVCGGENIYPGEVQALLERHPGVHQALVLPFAHELKGQVPYAFIVRKQGSGLSEEELRQFALANGPAYQHPRRVFFLDSLPLAGTNKVDIDRLRCWVAAGARVPV